MRTGTAAFLIGAAFAVLLALAIATVALGVVTALRVNDDRPPPPITRHGRWELRRLPDGTHEYAWIARQAGRFGPETDRPPTPRGRHRIPA
ncbi:hypothetical protein RMN57_20555 [Kitasatospora sp. CM 4170]|uniref:Secreted protein n=1 Tax=Kitasatospora aburaviensis TaxID=67265 RepID=A0ABW1F3E5_9ACTN|nr:hypothetical protein [Kitasatospora sp. CM 4170]WNM46918.1 hypothetical protein RMN57_20555 [Kitasatospora sp. CM 4170]